MREEEVTLRMGHRELLGLIEATSPSVHERVTARMTAVEPALAVDHPSAQTSSPDFIIKFHAPARAVARYRVSGLLIAVSFVASMAAGMGLAALIM
jgi:hypothetical protein